MNTLGSGYRLFAWPYWWQHWFSWRTYFYYVKYKIQRAQRGWADCDVWSLDNYLSQWLPDALRHLKETKHGIPMAMFTDEEASRQDPEGWTGPDDTAMERAGKVWGTTLDKMIEGFEAWNRMDEGLYEKELGEYPMWNLDDINKPDPVREERFKKSEVLRERDDKIFKEGMALFTQHFGSLWD